MLRKVLLLLAASLALAVPAFAQSPSPTAIVLAPRSGAEITDLIVPFAILRASGAIETHIAAQTMKPVAVMPGDARIVPQITMSEVEARYPDGVDLIVVPASHTPDDPELIAWVRRQHERGARIASVCDGAFTLAAAGLLDGRRAAAHWNALPQLRRRYPRVSWVNDTRWVDDGPITTTSGVSAAIPASLHLVELLAGQEAMRFAAAQLGLGEPSSQHDATAFTLSARHIGVAAGNTLAFWAHERVAVAPAPGFDELSVAFALDGWSRTWRSNAVLVAPSAGVTSRFGLVMLPAATRGREPAHRVRLRPSHADPLMAILEDIGARYGAPTARFVALQLEHPGGLQ